MKTIRASLALPVILTLSACGGGGGSTGSTLNPTPVSSALGTIGGGGQIDIALRDETNQAETVTQGLAAYVLGFDDTAGTAVAQAAVSPTSVGSAGTTGTAIYDTNYQVGVIDGVDRSGSTATGVVSTSSGTGGVLSADFDASTLTGTLNSDSSFGTSLDVSGTISGTDLSGTAVLTHEDSGAAPGGTLTVTIDGQIGDSGVIGAFHGSDTDTVAAGYFAGDT